MNTIKITEEKIFLSYSEGSTLIFSKSKTPSYKLGQEYIVLDGETFFLEEDSE